MTPDTLLRTIFIRTHGCPMGVNDPARMSDVPAGCRAAADGTADTVFRQTPRLEAAVTSASALAVHYDRGPGTAAASLSEVRHANSKPRARLPRLIASRQATFDNPSGASARTYQEAV